jgi:CrcB protein
LTAGVADDSYRATAQRQELNVLKIFAVGIGGFLGAIGRYGLSGVAHRLYTGSFPLGTFTVNVAGCFLLGSLMTLVEDRQLFSANTRLLLTIGLLGSFTTFSTLGYETLQLVRDRVFHLAILNILANVVLGIAAVILGRAVIKMAGI